MSSSNCCFLTCIQISQEAGQVVWYAHLFQNFPQLIVIHTVKGFGIVKKAEIDVFWNSLAFSMIQQMLAIWSLVPLPFLKPVWTSGSSRFTLNKIYLFTLNMESEGWQLLMMVPQLSKIQNLHNSLGFSLCSSQRIRGFSYLSKRVQNKWVKAISSEKWKASRKLHLILLPLTFYWPELCQMVTSRK